MNLETKNSKFQILKKEENLNTIMIKGGVLCVCVCVFWNKALFIHSSQPLYINPTHQGSYSYNTFSNIKMTIVFPNDDVLGLFFFFGSHFWCQNAPSFFDSNVYHHCVDDDDDDDGYWT